MTSKNPERHPIERTGLYRIPNQRPLAKLLSFDLNVLKKAAARPRPYYHFKDDTINGKARKIRTPYGLMRRIHERLKTLLNRIERPDFLHSPRHGSSYVTNAKVHVGSSEAGRLDIKQFYPSTTSEHVFQFFRHDLGVRDDVAGLLTKLCTIEDRVAFGSPLSPILSFHVHRRLFLKIQKLCASNGLKMTLYVDDISISGDKILGSTLHEIKSIIRQRDLRYHKVRKRSVQSGVTVTGVKVTTEHIEPANKSHRKLKEKLEQLDATSDLNEKKNLTNSIIGLHYHILQTYSPGHPARARAQRRHAGFHNLRRRIDRALDPEAAHNNSAKTANSAEAKEPPF